LTHDDEVQAVSPNQPRPGNKGRYLLVHDDLWDPAKAKAEAEGTNISAVIRRLLREYISDNANNERDE
jgi:hypothetical protein